jgi:hypothetical protein
MREMVQNESMTLTTMIEIEKKIVYEINESFGNFGECVPSLYVNLILVSSIPKKSTDEQETLLIY